MADNETRNIILEVLKNVIRFRKRIFVTKLSGSVADDAKRLALVLRDIDILSVLGIRQVLIHGAGNAISESAKKAGLVPEFIDGERVTTEPVMRIVFETLMGINGKIVASARDLDSRFIPPVELETDGKPIVTAGRKDPRLGLVGKIDWMDTERIHAVLDDGHIPVIPSLAVGPGGRAYNVNADDMAGFIALGLKAEKLIFVSDVPGVMHGNRLLETIDERTSEELILGGIISDGMIPKVRSIFETIKGGVRNVHLIGGDSFHSLLMEIMTETGVGTMFSS